MSDPIIIVNDPQPERKKLRWRQWITKFKAHGAFCHYCKIPLLFKHAVREHMTPICRGGADYIDNIVPACALCNGMKAWRTADEFMRDRPALLQKFTANRGIDKPKPRKISQVAIIALEERNEPGLLKKLVNERENRSRWWKTA